MRETIPEDRLKVIAESGTNCFKHAVPSESEAIAKELFEARERISKAEARNKVLEEALQEFLDCLPPDRCPDPNCGGDCALRARADAALREDR